MNLIETMGFSGLSSNDLEAYAREKAALVGLNIPDAYFPAVLETLGALQTHAAILAAKLEAADRPPSRISAP